VKSFYFSSAQRAHNKLYIRWDNILLTERGPMGIFARPRYINCSILALELKYGLKISPLITLCLISRMSILLYLILMSLRIASEHVYAQYYESI
jgi:hypothetical protein